VGNYLSDETYSVGSYLYNGGNYTTLNVPGQVNGIDGNYVVGNYPLASDGHAGFVYSGTDYSTLIVPGAMDTYATGISGNNIVGIYSADGSTYQGFIYSGGNYTTLDVPGGENTQIYGVDGNNIVGYYYNGSAYEGFLATPVPEPSAFALVGLSGLSLLVFRRQRK
jgi:hypothetical protein